MKNTLIALTLTIAAATPALSGNMAEPVMEPEIIVVETQTASSGSAALPFILFALLAVAAAN